HNVIPSSWFEPGDSLGSKIASEYAGATTLEQASSILYLAAILMVISLVTNVVAQFIVVRFEPARRAVRRGRQRNFPRAAVVHPVSRRDPHGHLARDQRRGAVHRPLRTSTESRMTRTPAGVDPYDITVRSNGLKRRRIVEKVFGALALLSALLACG